MLTLRSAAPSAANGRREGMARARLLLAIAVSAMTLGPASAGDLAVSANDAHTVLADGAQVAASGDATDTVSLIDMTAIPPRIVGAIEAPASVVGPPMAVGLATRNGLAVVSAATRLDPNDATKIVPDDRVTLIDVAASPPRALQQVRAGAGAAAVAVSPDESLVLVANRVEGTVSIFALADRTLEPLGKLDLGNPKSGPSGLLFLPDGKRAILSRDADHILNVLRIEGRTVSVDKRVLTAGVRPYTLSLAPSRNLVAATNMGRGDGDMDTVSLIDVGREPFRVIDTFSVGGSPEGVRFSPDGRFLAVGVQDGSTKPDKSPFKTVGGRLVLFDVTGEAPRKLAEAAIGGWSQGIAFSRDGGVILAQNMVERNFSVFRWDGRSLQPAPPLPAGTGPAAIATPW